MPVNKIVIASGKFEVEEYGEINIAKKRLGYWAKWFKNINEAKKLDGKKVKLILEVED